MARSAEYNRLSLSTSQTSGDAIVANCYMSGRRQLSHPRKRRPTEQHPLQQNETLQPQSKRRRLGYHSSRSSPPAAFWDSLSKIWLTKGALRELDKRNTQSVSNLPPLYQQVIKPIQSASDFLHNCAPRTLKDTKRFARYGGPDLSDLRVVCIVRNLISGVRADDTLQYPEFIHPFDRTMGSRLPSSRHQKQGPMSTTKETTSSRPKDPNYQQKLIDSNVLPHGYEYPDGHEPPLPQNWDEINRRLAQRRPSLSPSAFLEEKFQAFVEKNNCAFNEDAVKDSELPAMLEAMGASDGAFKNILFTNIDPITDNIAYAKPDYYYGAQPEQIHQDVRDQLSKNIVPSKHSHLPTVPNFFLEAKGPDGSLPEARRQALHDGAIGARAMQSIQSYGKSEPVYDNNAYTISSTYHGGTLKIYSHSTTQPYGHRKRPEYYMHQLGAYAMAHSKETFRDGAKAFKNARDLTTEYRNAAIARANEMLAQTIEGEEDEEETEEEEEEEEEE